MTYSDIAPVNHRANQRRSRVGRKTLVVNPEPIYAQFLIVNAI